MIHATADLVKNLSNATERLRRLLYAITPNFINEEDLSKFLSNISMYPISHLILRNKNHSFIDMMYFRSFALNSLQTNIKVIINPNDIPFNKIHESQYIHLNSKNLFKATTNKLWASASCHNIEEITAANKLNLEFVFLSPVLDTNKYQFKLGWEKFSKLAKQSKHPVVALGGIRQNDLETAISYGASGIAGISMFGT